MQLLWTDSKGAVHVKYKEIQYFWKHFLTHLVSILYSRHACMHHACIVNAYDQLLYIHDQLAFLR